MLEIHCQNAVGFDAVTQTYKTCNQRIRVPADRAGTNVICPRCQAAIKVPMSGGSEIKDDLSASDANNADVMSMDFDAQQQSRVFTANQQRCPKCGGRFSAEGQCEQCGYLDPAQAAARKATSAQPLQPAGFQLWLGSLANEGVSIAIVGYFVFAAIMMFCGVVVAWGILSTSIVGAAVAAIAGLVAFLSVLILVKSRQLATVRNAELGILSPFWNSLLILARLQNWQNYDGNLKGRKIIDCRQSPIDDAGLEGLAGLQGCHVLDLENSNITDQGLKRLYGLTKLQCLVLKNTNVSAEAVTTLQQHYPRLWIWH